MKEKKVILSDEMGRVEVCTIGLGFLPPRMNKTLPDEL